MEQMCKIGVGIIYPDRFAVIDLIVREGQFEKAKNTICRVNKRIENDNSFAESFDPKHGYAKALKCEEIDSCVLAYWSDTTDESDEGKNLVEFFVDLDK